MTVDTQSTDQSVAQQLTTTTYVLFTPCSRLHRKPQLLWNLRWRNGLNLELFLGYVWAWTMRTIRYQGYKQQLSFFKVTIKFNRFSLRVRSWQTYLRESHNLRVSLSTAIFRKVVIPYQWRNPCMFWHVVFLRIEHFNKTKRKYISRTAKKTICAIFSCINVSKAFGD